MWLSYVQDRGETKRDDKHCNSSMGVQVGRVHGRAVRRGCRQHLKKERPMMEVEGHTLCGGEAVRAGH